jgi:DNA-binding IclR family transcriptional regulator
MEISVSRSAPAVNGPSVASDPAVPMFNEVPAVARAIAIVRYLDRAPPGGAGLSAISADLGITKSHCLNILRTLVHEDWIVLDPLSRRYELSIHLLDAARSLLTRERRAASLHQELVALATATSSPSVFTRVEDDGSYILVDKIETGGVPVSGPIGHRYPWDAPAQLRARLAWSEPSVVRQFLRKAPTPYTERTLVRRPRILAEIEETRARGYAKAYGEYVHDIVSYAVPLMDTFGTVRAIVQCVTHLSDAPQREDKLIAALLRTRDRMQVIF